MEPLVAVIPQSLRVLVERLPAYLDFLRQQGFSIYQQTSTTLSSAQAAILYSRTQDELFIPETPVAVLLLEREDPYTAFNALREQLDIVYGSTDRVTAMQDIHAFFAVDTDSDDEEEGADIPLPPPPIDVDPPSTEALILNELPEKNGSAPPPPTDPLPEANIPEPSSPAPPPPADDEEAALLGPNAAQSEPQSPVPGPPADDFPPPPPADDEPPTHLPEDPRLSTPTPTQGDEELTVVEEASDAAPLPAHFQWEEIEPTQNGGPSSPSPLPSSPSPPLTPLPFEPTPTPSITSSPYEDIPSDLPQPITPSPYLDHSPPPPPPNTSTLPSLAYLLRSHTTPIPTTTHPSPLPIIEPESPLQAPDIKRASLTTSPPVKGPSDLLSLPSRMSIKERLAALNLSPTPAPAQGMKDPIRMEGGEGERRASLKEKADRLNDLFTRRMTLPGVKVKKAGLFASIQALGGEGEVPTKGVGSDEYREGLPGVEAVLAQECLHGVLHHMTGEDEEWGQRYCILHHDSLYLLAGVESNTPCELMLLVSAAGMGVAYAEGVIEIKGEVHRHLFAAELEDIDRWYHAINKAKLTYASEERRQEGGDEEEEGEVKQRRASLKESPQASALASALAAAIMGRAIQPTSLPPPSVQEEIRQMRGNRVAGVAAARPVSPVPHDEVKAATPTQPPRPPALTIQPPPTPPIIATHLPMTLPSIAPVAVPVVNEDGAFLRSLLLHGSEFKKYKHKRGKQRWLWCSPALDRLYWGEVKGRKVKGYMMAVDMCSVGAGCVGVKKVECAMTIIGKERTLDLEAGDEEQRTHWIRAISLLINLARS